MRHTGHSAERMYDTGSIHLHILTTRCMKHLVGHQAKKVSFSLIFLKISNMALQSGKFNMNHHLLITLLFTVNLAGAAGSQAPPVTLQADDFRCYPFGWTPIEGGLLSGTRDAGNAKLIDAPRYRTVSIEADVRVEDAPGKEWKVAAVALFEDPQNYWHWGLVEAPDGSGKPNFCELAENREGIWNAQADLKMLAHEKTGGPWKRGVTYRLRIALTPETIEGSLHDTDGRLVERKRFALRDPAVRTGRPALRSPGMAARFTNIQAAWGTPVPDADGTTTFPPYQSDSFVPGINSRATGFFRVEQRDGTWWAIDPLGRGHVPMGVDHVTYTGHWCEQLGYAPYHRAMRHQYPNRDDWVRETTHRLQSWGFNRLGGHAYLPMVHQGLSYSRFVGVGTPMARLGDACNITPNEGRPCTAFPNVFHPQFEAYCRYQAELTCQPVVDDPWLFGYFLDNELAWWGRGDPETGLFDAVMTKNATHTAKIALKNFLADRYRQDVQSLNRAWKTDLASLNEILQRQALDGAASDIVRNDKHAFLALVADRYFAITTRAIRTIDKNHLILGCRFAGGRATDAVWAAAARYCDVLSLNYYGSVDLDRGVALDDDHSARGEPLAAPFAKMARQAQGKPLLVTEWSFIALDSGLPCTNGAGQRFYTQAERARAAGIFAESLLRIPELIGFDYFMWSDEPALGISEAFPENSNYGLVDGENRIYDELTANLSSVLHRAGELRVTGPRPPASHSVSPAIPKPASYLAQNKHEVAESPPSPALERRNQAFRIDNGKLVLRGTLDAGPELQSMHLNDVLLGYYVTTAHQWDGRHHWARVNKVTHIDSRHTGDVLQVDLTARCEPGPGANPPLPFEVRHRLHLRPGTNWFVLELLSYRNLGDREVDLRDVYFQVFSQLEGPSDKARKETGKRVPRLWGRPVGDAWVHAQAKAYVGIIGAPRSAQQVHYWLNESGGQHPDAYWTTACKLAPGAVLNPEQPVYWIIAAGPGDADSWNRHWQDLGSLQP